MKMSSKIVGLPEAERAVARIGAKTRVAAEEAIALEAEEIRAGMAALAPKKTGALAGSFHVVATGLNAVVQTLVRYAMFVERGTGHGRAQPYALPTAEVARPRFPARVGAAVRRALLG